MLTLFFEEEFGSAVVRRVGLEPKICGDVSPTKRFFAASFPLFSFWGSFACRVRDCLVGGEVNEWKDSQLSILRQDAARRDMERTKAFERKPSGMPQVPVQKNLEGWASFYAFWVGATISLQEMPLSIFEALAVLSPSSLFFLKERVGFVEEAFFLEQRRSD
jgi:hypothetical protein